MTRIWLHIQPQQQDIEALGTHLQHLVGPMNKLSFSSPIAVVLNKDGTMRLCIDYPSLISRMSNICMLLNNFCLNFPLPKMDQSGSQCLSLN